MIKRKCIVESVPDKTEHLIVAIYFFLKIISDLYSESEQTEMLIKCCNALRLFRIQETMK